MTRPIYEPTPTRKDAYLDFQDQQLFRRPRPAAAAGGEVAYAVMEWTAGADIADDTKTIVSFAGTGEYWAEGYINDAGLALTPQPFALDFTLGTITFRCSGLYHAQFTVNWADTFPAGPSYLDTILEYFGDCPLTSPCGDWASSDVMFNNQDWMAQWQQSVGHVISVQDPDNDSWFRGSVIQKTGTGAKFLSGAALIVTRLADFDATTGEFFTSGT